MKRNHLTVLVCVLLAVLVALVLLGSSCVASEAVYPAENAGCRAVAFLHACARGWLDAQTTRARCDALARENESLRLVRNDNENLRRENDRLRALAGFPVHAGKARWVPASILSRDGVTGVRHFLRLDRGTRDGVREGAAVAVPEGVVGQVTEVGPNVCRVVPITDPSVRIAARIETGDPSADAVYGILYGNGAYVQVADGHAAVVLAVSPLRLGHLGAVAAQEVPPQARVVTSGLGGVFPAGLTLGRLVAGTVEDKSRLERQADVRPAVDLATLGEVFIRCED